MKRTHTNRQSGNKVELCYGSDLNIPLSYRETLENGWIVEVLDREDDYVGSLIHIGVGRILFEDNACFIDALSDIERYLESIGIIWSYENYLF